MNSRKVTDAVKSITTVSRVVYSSQGKAKSKEKGKRKEKGKL